MLGFLLSASFASAWTGPSSSPPNGNVSAPINTSTTGQVKQGDFGILGNLGVGTPSPGYKLDLQGTLRSTGNLIVNQGWSPAQELSINSNQIWKSQTAGDSGLYLQWSNPGGAVNVGGQSGATNNLNVYGGIWSRDSVTAPQYCIGGSCITSWTSAGVGGTGTANYVPRWTSASALGNSTISSDGVSATANGNFFVTNAAYVRNGLDVQNANGAYTYITLHDDESPNGVKYIHANSNAIGFLSGQGNWITYWDNSGNQTNYGSISNNDSLNICTGNRTGCYLRYSDDGYIQDNNDGWLRNYGNFDFQNTLRTESNLQVGGATYATNGDVYMPYLGAWQSAAFCRSDGTNCPASTQNVVHNDGGNYNVNAQHLLINYATWASNWYWSGQGGQPTWLWGSNDGTNMYVWNPSNFSVSHANRAAGGDNNFNINGGGNNFYDNGDYLHIGGARVTVDGELRAPLLRDSNDGNWYVDPNGNTTIAGSVAIGTTGFDQKLKVAGNAVIDNIYLPYMGDWLSNRLNQSVVSGASPTFGWPTVHNLYIQDYNGGPIWATSFARQGGAQFVVGYGGQAGQTDQYGPVQICPNGSLMIGFGAWGGYTAAWCQWIN